MTSPWPSTLPAELLAARELVYDPCGLEPSLPVAEPESAAYGAHSLVLAGRGVRFRVARTTPTKLGQFVTLWNRSCAGPIRPFDDRDGIDLVVVAVQEDGPGARRGQMVLPADVLVEHGVMSRDGAGGRRAVRVYPPWVTPTSRQAQRSQAWQCEHFLPTGPGTVDHDRARALYGRGAEVPARG